MQYADLFKLRSIPAWIFRYVEQFLFRLLYGLANGMEMMVNHLASILAFLISRKFRIFTSILVLASFAFLAIALMFQGYNFILGKRKPFLIYSVIRCWEFCSLSLFHESGSHSDHRRCQCRGFRDGRRREHYVGRERSCMTISQILKFLRKVENGKT